MLIDNLGFEPVSIDSGDKFARAAEFTFSPQIEGGYTVDHAGPTNYGITQNTLNSFNKKYGYPGMNVKDMTPDDARFVAQREYFEAPGFDKLPADTATALFDFGYNAGPTTAIKTLQSIIGAKPDGQLGPKTVAATDQYIQQNGEKNLIKSVIDKRQAHYQNLIQENPGKYKKYENGWMNRIKALKDRFDIGSLLGEGTAHADELPADYGDIGFEPATQNKSSQNDYNDLGFAPDNAGDQSKAQPPQTEIHNPTPNFEPPEQKRMLNKYYDPLDNTDSNIKSDKARVYALDESYKKGLYGHVPLPAFQKVSEEHPVISAIGEGMGQVTGLLGIGTGVGALARTGVKSAIEKYGVSLLPEIMTSSKIASSSATFGVKSALDKLSGAVQGKPVTGEDVKSVLFDAATGLPFGAADSIAKPILRIPAQAMVMAGAAKLQGANDLQTAISGAVGALFGALHTSDLGMDYKKQAVAKVHEDLSLKLHSLGVPLKEAVNDADRYIYGGAVKTTGISDTNKAMDKVLADPANNLDYFEAMDKQIKEFSPETRKVIQSAAGTEGGPKTNRVEPIPSPAAQDISTQGAAAPDTQTPASKTPEIQAAEAHGTVVGIDAKTKLPIIDTSKPAATGTDLTTNQGVSNGQEEKGRQNGQEDVLKATQPGETPAESNPHADIGFVPEASNVEVERRQKLIEQAHGPEDNRATQAARRILGGQNIDWKNTLTKNDQLDANNLLDWESSQEGGKIWSFINNEGNREFNGAPSAHSDAMQDIGPQESFKLLQRVKEGDILTEKQHEKVQQLLSDYRTNIKSSLEEVLNARQDLSESQTAEVIDSFKKEGGYSEADWEDQESYRAPTSKESPNAINESQYEYSNTPLKNIPTGNEAFNNEKQVETKTGVPIILKSYHGTTYNFDKFIIDNPNIGKRGSYSGKGIYFTPNKYEASGFVGNNGRVIEAVLDIKNPYVVYLPEGNIDKDLSGTAKMALGRGHDAMIVRIKDIATDNWTEKNGKFHPKGEVESDWIKEIVVFDESIINAYPPPKSIAEPSTPYSKSPTFYSKAEQVIKDKMPNAAPAEMVKGILNAAGVKQDELDWMDIDGFLKENPKPTKAQLLEHIRNNNVQLQEVMKGEAEPKSLSDLQDAQKKYSEERLKGLKVLEDAGLPQIERVKLLNDLEANNPGAFEKAAEVAPGHDWNALYDAVTNEEIAKQSHDDATSREVKFKAYQLPGGKNYKELLLTLPSKNVVVKHKTKSPAGWGDLEGGDIGVTTQGDQGQDYRSGHFDEPNVLAHVRMNDRIDADGKKVLFIEEVQSDWHQRGRKVGYKLSNHIDPDFQNGVPDAPFKKTWHELAMKRMLRYAAEHGYDKLAWTTGEQQAERYDLSKQVDSIDFEKDRLNKEVTVAVNKDGKRIDVKKFSIDNPSAIEDYAGKDVAKKIGESQDLNGTLSGVDLKVGGEGMKGFYDQILPSFMNKYTKKWGGRVGAASIPSRAQGRNIPDGAGGIVRVSDTPNHVQVHSIDLTPSMRNDILQIGQPLFEKGSDYAPQQVAQFKTEEINKAFGSQYAAKQAIFTTAQDIGSVHPAGGRSPAQSLRRGSNSLSSRKLARQLIAQGYVDHVGQTVRNAGDVAELASVFRSPYLEHFQVIYLKGDKVVAHNVLTSGAPDSVSLQSLNRNNPSVTRLLTKLHLAAKRLGADAIYFAHNHPSGNPAPSNADIHFTQGVGWTFQNLSKQFKYDVKVAGHVVTDGDNFSLIDATTLSMPGNQFEKVEYNTPKADLKRPVKTAQIRNAEQAATAARQFVKFGKVAVIYTNTRLETVAVGLHDKDGQLNQAIKDGMRANVATAYFIAYQSNSAPVLKNLPAGLKDIIELGAPGSKEGYKALGDNVDVDQPQPNKLKFVQEETAPYDKEAEPVKEKEKTRKFINTVKESDNTLPEVAAAVESTYTPISNDETMRAAQEYVKNNYDQAVDLVEGSERPTAFSNAVAIELIRKAQAEDRTVDAVMFVERTAEKQTELGQAIQALSMYNRLSPEGVLMAAARAIKKAKAELPPEKIKNFEQLAKDLKGEDLDKLAKRLGIPHLSEQLAKELQKMAEDIAKMPDGRPKEIKTAQMLKRIGDEIPRTFWEKVSMVQTLAQLLNPKTFIRNLLGNLGFQTIENLADTVATGLDIAAALRTGERTVGLPSIKTQAKGAVQGFKEGKEEALLGVDLRNTQSKFTLPKNGVFDKGVMGALEKTLRVSLGATDRAFYQAAFNDSLRQQMQFSNVSEPTEEMIEKAHLLGMYRTFQDDNVLSRQFVALKKWFNVNKKFGLGDMVLKYPKTPANILARGLEYSPFGFAKTIFTMAEPLVGREFNQEAFSRGTARALTGSVLLVGVGAMLAALGIISGKRSKDKDVSAARENVGIRDYQINASALKRFASSGMDPAAAQMQEDDLLVNYDWLQPASIGVALGANMMLDPKSNLPDKILNMGERLMQASDTLQEQPLVQGVKTLFSTRDVGQGLSDIVQGVPASFVPTLLNQVRQITDNTSRNTKDPNYFQEMYKKTVARIPGASSTLPARINTLGQEKEMFQLGSNNPFNVFLNPAFVSKYKPDPVSKMVLDIWESSGETIQFPRVAEAKIKLGSQTREPVELSADQYTEYQKYIGQKTSVAFGLLANDAEFMSQSDESKAKRLQRILTNINTDAKRNVLMRGEVEPKRDISTTLKAIGKSAQSFGPSDDLGFEPAGGP